LSETWRPDGTNAKKYYIPEALRPSAFINRATLFVCKAEIARSDHASPTCARLF
jgi:hypothetical protein